jgi:hypothetical protein
MASPMADDNLSKAAVAAEIAIPAAVSFFTLIPIEAVKLSKDF